MSTARDTIFNSNDFASVVRFYNLLRKEVYEHTEALHPPFKCSKITLSDAINADTWRTVNHRAERSEWSWVQAFKNYDSKSAFKRFDLCVKNGSNLVGLAYGMPTKAKTKLKIDIIESTPIKEHKLNGGAFEIISTSAQAYAALLGADEIRIMNPLNKELSNFYGRFGYERVEPVKKSLGVYCSMKLEG